MKKALILIIAALVVLGVAMTGIASAHVSEIRLGGAPDEYLGRVSTTSITYPVRFVLKGAPIVPNSQVIWRGTSTTVPTMIGAPLTEGVHYTVDDQTGEVLITSGLATGWYMWASYLGISSATPSTIALNNPTTETVLVRTFPRRAGVTVTGTSTNPAIATVDGPYVTDANGEATFTITCVAVGTTTITFTAPGYSAAVLTVVQVKSGAGGDPVGDTPYTFVETASDTAVPSTGFSDTFRPEPWKMGASAWRYADSRDASYKYEGSYRAFDDNTTVLPGNATALGLYTVNPHGGYDTTSNKCKTCHAVHRASGAFKLMRVDNPDDACSYCHIGSHRHATLQAYSGGLGTIYPANGHTIDSGKSIPDSSIEQWLQAKTLASGDKVGETYEHSVTINVRRYNPKKLRLWVISAQRSSYHHAWTRYGPTLLTCMSCHQPHNADDLVWKPDGTNKYRLLRAAPSGSVKSTEDMNKDSGSTTYALPNFTDFAIKAIEEDAGNADLLPALRAANTVTLSATTSIQGGTGTATVIYTPWETWSGADVPITPRRLSVWCADCHNLDIGTLEKTNKPNFRGGSSGEFHSDRTHSVPFRGGPYGLECYSCHRADMETTPDTRLGGAADETNTTHFPVAAGTYRDCARCHYGNDAIWGTWLATSDFPHTGATQSTKLLPDWYDGGVNPEHLDVICRKCHDLIGTEM